MSLLKRIEKSQQPVEAPSRLRELRVRKPAVGPPRDAYLDLKNRIQDRLIAELDPTMDISRTDEVRRTIEEMYLIVLSFTERPSAWVRILFLPPPQ